MRFISTYVDLMSTCIMGSGVPNLLFDQHSKFLIDYDADKGDVTVRHSKTVARYGSRRLAAGRRENKYRQIISVRISLQSDNAPRLALNVSKIFPINQNSVNRLTL